MHTVETLERGGDRDATNDCEDKQHEEPMKNLFCILAIKTKEQYLA